MAGKQVNFEVNVDSSDGIRGLKDFGKAAEKAGKDAAKAFDETASSGDKARAAIKAMASTFDAELRGAASAAEALSDALGPELTGRMDVNQIVADLNRMGVSFEEIRAEADQYAATLREVDGIRLQQVNDGLDTTSAKLKQLGDTKINVDTSQVEGGLKRTKQGLDDTRASSDQTKSVMANMAGNTAQELGELGGVVGSLGVGIGQMAEYATEGNISLSQLAKLAGPVGLLSAISVGVGLFSKWKAAAAELTENTNQATEAFEEGVGSIDDWTAAVDNAFETGTAGADAFSREILRAFDKALDPQQLDDMRIAMSKLGVTFEDLGGVTRAVEQDFADYATSQLLLKNASDGVAAALGPMVEEFGNADEILQDIENKLAIGGPAFRQFGDDIPTEDVVAFVEANKDFINSLDEIEEGFNRVDIEKAAQKFLQLEKSVDPATKALVQQSIEQTRAADGTIDYIAALEDYVAAQQAKTRADEAAAAQAEKNADEMNALMDVYNQAEAVLPKLATTSEAINAAMARQKTEANTLAAAWQILLADMRDGTVDTQLAVTAYEVLAEALHLTKPEMDALVAQEFDKYMADVATAEEEAAKQAFEMAEAMADLGDTIATIDTDDLANLSGALETELNKVDDIFAGLKFDVDFQPALNEALDGLDSFGPDLQTLADEWANILEGQPVNIFGNVRADDAEFQEKMAGLTNLFQEGVVNAFDQGGVDAANTFVQSTAAQIAASSGLDIAEVYRIMGLPPDGSIDTLIQPQVDAEATADAMAILEGLAGVDNPVAAYLALALQTDTITPQVAEIAAQILAGEELGVPAKLEGVAQADIEAALAWLAGYGVTVDVEVDDGGTVQGFRRDADDATEDRTTQVIVPKSDSLGQMQTLIDHVARSRTVAFNSKADNAGQIDGILDGVAADRDAEIWVRIPNYGEANQSLNRLAQRRDSYIYVHTVPVGGSSKGGSSGPTSEPAMMPVGAAPMAMTTADGVGVSTLAAPAPMSISPVTMALPAAAAGPVVNNMSVTVKAAVIGNRHEVERTVAKALRSYTRLNGSEELMSAPTIIGVERARPRVDLGVGDSRDATGLGQWQPAGGNAANTRWVATAATTGTSTWNGEEPHWIDVTCYGIEIETYTGRDRATDQWEVGTATIVLANDNGWADYPPTSDPNPLDLTVRPGRQVRVCVSVDGGEPQVLWRGWVDEANPGFDAEYGDIVTLECIDAKGEVGRADVAAVDPPVGAGESIDARLDRICDEAVWGDFWRNFDGSGIDVVGTALGAQAADLLNRAADSGGGSIFGDVDGKLRYRNRDWQLWPADDAEDATIGNVFPGSFDETELTESPAGSGLFHDPAGVLVVVESPAGSGLYDVTSPSLTRLEDPAGSGLFVFGVLNPGDVCPINWEMGFARADITTRVLVARPDMDTPIVLDDVAGQEIYGIEPVDLTDLETLLDVEMTQIGNRLLVTRGHTTMPRIAGVTLNAATSPDVVDLLATADPRTPSRFRCRHSSGDRQVFSRFMFCTAVRHTIGPDLWEARLSLDDALPWQVGGTAGFWHNTDSTGAGHWQQSTWQADIEP